jgi:hypothetical protein
LGRRFFSSAVPASDDAAATPVADYPPAAGRATARRDETVFPAAVGRAWEKDDNFLPFFSKNEVSFVETNVK